MPISGTNLGTAHPTHFERFRRLRDFHSVAEMRSVSPIYARLRNAKRIIGPPEAAQDRGLFNASIVIEYWVNTRTQVASDIPLVAL